MTIQWKGPFNVIDVSGENDYKIDIGGKHKIFHINMLKKYEVRES